MAKKIRKVFRRSYDKLSANDYGLGADNLNPLRNTEIETQLQEVLNECQVRINKIKTKYNIPDDENEVVSNPTIEGMEDQLNRMLSKINKNPLRTLQEMDIDPTSLVGNKALEQMGHPICLDCAGVGTIDKLKQGDLSIDFLGQDEDDDGNGNGNGNGDEDDADLDTEYTITYDLGGATSPVAAEVLTWPKTYTMRNPQFVIPSSLKYEEGKVFKGWYLDSSHSEKIKNNKFLGYSRDVILYAFGDKPSDEDDSPLLDTSEQNPEEDPNDNNLDCAVQEMEWIKIILAVCKVIKMIIQIVVLILSILVPLINIVKEAILAWVNPSNIASIINRVAQKLIAIVFSIIMALIMKLWSLLNFDCVSDAALDVIAQINELLAGIAGAFGSVDELACAIDGLAGIDWSQMGKQFAFEMEKSTAKMGEMFNENYNTTFPTPKSDNEKEFGNQWNAGDENPDYVFKEVLKTLGDFAEDWTWESIKKDPKKLYNQCVPPEIRNKVEALISGAMEGYNTTMQTIDTTKSMINMFKGIKETTNKPRGVSEGNISPSSLSDFSAADSMRDAENAAKTAKDNLKAKLDKELSKIDARYKNKDGSQTDEQKAKAEAEKAKATEKSNNESKKIDNELNEIKQ